MAAALNNQLFVLGTAGINIGLGISGSNNRRCWALGLSSDICSQRRCDAHILTSVQSSRDYASVGWSSTVWGFGWGIREPRLSIFLTAVEAGHHRSGNAPLPEYQSPKCTRDIRHRAVPKGDFTGDDSEGFIRSNLAVFLSGGGSNFRALHASTVSNSIFGDIIVVVSDKPGCQGCEYAREHNIPVFSYPRLVKHAPDGLSAADLVAALRKLEVDYVLLAGYLKLIPEELVKAYPRSILNIHPALLPAFGGKGYFGMKVHEAVIKSGARFSGPTVHFVDEKYDTGPILAQRVVPVLADDSANDLAARVLKEEHVLYSEAVAALCEDRVFWREDGVPLIRRSWEGAAEYY